jgi:hypothetical protein
LVAFQWDATCKVWTYDSKVMRFLRFHPKFGHTVTHCQCNRICPNLPTIAKIYPKKISTRNFEISPKVEILVFFQKENSINTGGTKAWAYRLDFQSKNFPNAFLNVKKRPLYVNFSISLCQDNMFFKVPYVLWIWDFVDIYLTHNVPCFQDGLFWGSFGLKTAIDV